MLVRQKTLKLAGVKGKVKWLTSNKKVATVSANGIVKGVKAGTAKITAKVGKKKYTCKITVKAVKKTTAKKNTKKALSKSFAPQTSTSATEQNNSTSQNTSADTSEANTESTDYLTTDITLSDDTRIVTKKDTNVVDLEEGKQYIDVRSAGDKVQEIFTHGNGDEYYKYVRVHFNGHVYLTDGHTYLSGCDDYYRYEAYIEIVKVLS